MSVAGIYQNGQYLAMHPTWHSEDAPWKVSQIRNMLTQHRIEPATICEVGCGAGEILAGLQHHSAEGTEFWGYEISPQAYELCHRHANANLHFELGDILEDGPVRFYDVVLLMDVVEHVEDHMRFLRQVRMLGQYKIFHFPLDLSVQGVARSIPSKVRDTAGHLHYFTKDLALRTLEDAGYHVFDWFYTPAAAATQSPGLGTRLMQLPRKVLFALNRDAAALWCGGFSMLVLAV
ncbi:MAG TPA: methyltransferase domain-containing protein [Bryobacteraceae bacterium]|nr:methyltransferase domain-containing protein [Bryobacteraceae bacterium]